METRNSYREHMRIYAVHVVSDEDIATRQADVPIVADVTVARQLVFTELFIVSLCSGTKRPGGIDKFAALFSGLAGIIVRVISMNTDEILGIIDRGKFQAGTKRKVGAAFVKEERANRSLPIGGAGEEVLVSEVCRGGTVPA